MQLWRVVVLVGGAFVYEHDLFKSLRRLWLSSAPTAASARPFEFNARERTVGGVKLGRRFWRRNRHRLERSRRGVFVTLTSLSANSASFLDVTVQPGLSMRIE